MLQLQYPKCIILVMASVASAPYHHAQYSKPQRPPKDPNKPKKKKSAFDIFREEQFHEFKRLNPDTKLDLGGMYCMI